MIQGGEQWNPPAGSKRETWLSRTALNPQQGFLRLFFWFPIGVVRVKMSVCLAQYPGHGNLHAVKIVF